MKKLSILGVFCALMAVPARADSPIVLELFTSQGCSACPAADALLQKLSADPHLLPLSFHIDYWDQLGWKDPFSLPANTNRQTLYQKVFKQSNIYTPELVVDGQEAMIGSRRREVTAAIDAASATQKPLTVSLTPSPDHKSLAVDVTGTKPDDVPIAGIWLVTFSPKAVTAIRGGENSGREMTSINNVTSVTRLAEIDDAVPKHLQVKMSAEPDDGYAILVQAPAGRIIGAGSYLP